MLRSVRFRRRDAARHRVPWAFDPPGRRRRRCSTRRLRSPLRQRRSGHPRRLRTSRPIGEGLPVVAKPAGAAQRRSRPDLPRLCGGTDAALLVRASGPAKLAELMSTTPSRPCRCCRHIPDGVDVSIGFVDFVRVVDDAGNEYRYVGKAQSESRLREYRNNMVIAEGRPRGRKQRYRRSTGARQKALGMGGELRLRVVEKRKVIYSIWRSTTGSTEVQSEWGEHLGRESVPGASGQRPAAWPSG